MDVVECLLSCICQHFLTLYLLFCLTGVPWDCGAYYTNNFPKDKSNMLCIWPDRLYKLNTRSLFSFGVIVTYVLDSANDYLFYLLGELFGNNLVLAILFTMLQILYCNLFNGKLCVCQVFYCRDFTSIDLHDPLNMINPSIWDLTLSTSVETLPV